MTYQTNKIFSSKFKRQQGVTLLLSLLVLSAILSIAFSLAVVSLVEIKSSSDLIKTEPAYYAADAISEEALFKVKRNVPDCSGSVQSNCMNFGETNVGSVKLDDPELSSSQTPIFQVRIPKNQNSFLNTRQRFPIFNSDCPSPIENDPGFCGSGGSGFGRIKITYLNNGNTDKLRAYLCQYDPRKPIDPTGQIAGAYVSLPCSDPYDSGSNTYWLPDGMNYYLQNYISENSKSWNINPYMQQELILYNENSSGNADMFVSVESFDSNGIAKGLPLVGEQAVEIGANFAGIARKVRVTIPTGSASSGGATGGLAGYSYKRDIIIDHTKVANTDLSNFPLLVSWSDNTLRNGGMGHVSNASGYDIVFTDSNNNLLNFEKEKYDGVTGEIVYWVQIPQLSHTADTQIKMWYGNSSITTDQSNKTAVWDGDYKAVWHLKDNAANTVILDSTSNGANGTATANTSGKQATGQIGGALTFNGSTDYLMVANPLTIGTGNDTYSFWYKPNTVSGTIALAGFSSNIGNGFTVSFVQRNASQLRQFIYGAYGPNSQAVSAGTWYHVQVTTTGSSSQKLYVNGIERSNLAGPNPVGQQTYFYIGTTYPIAYENGLFDEVRLSSTARSADWIMTEYNNQSSPLTFYSIGAEQ